MVFSIIIPLGRSPTENKYTFLFLLVDINQNLIFSCVLYVLYHEKGGLFCGLKNICKGIGIWSYNA